MSTTVTASLRCGYNMPRGSAEFELVIQELRTEHIWMPVRFSPQDEQRVVPGEQKTRAFRPSGVATESTAGLSKAPRPLRRSNTVAASKLSKLSRSQTLGAFPVWGKRPLQRRVDSFTVHDSLSPSNLGDIKE